MTARTATTGAAQVAQAPEITAAALLVMTGLHSRVGNRRPGRTHRRAGGTQHLYQFHEHWVVYRSTAEALKHERYLHLAEATPYAEHDQHPQIAGQLEV